MTMSSIVSLTQHSKTKIAVSTSALFDMAEPDAIWEREKAGTLPAGTYRQFMRDNIDTPLKPGPLYDFIKIFLSHDDHELVIASKNSSLTGLRAIRTLFNDSIVPSQYIFTNGADIVEYLPVYGVNQFISTNQQDVEAASLLGIPCAHVSHNKEVDQTRIQELLSGTKETESNKISKLYTKPHLVVHNNAEADSKDQPPAKKGAAKTAFKKAAPPLAYALDFDKVVAGASSDDFFVDNGLDGYRLHEGKKFDHPIEEGPWFSEFKKMASDKTGRYILNIVTARGGIPGLRFMNMFGLWNIDTTGELHSMAGVDKTPVLEILKRRYPGILFLDDGIKNIERARKAGIAAGHVPSASPNKYIGA